MAPRRILQLVGSPTSHFHRELSELYACGCMEALHDPARYAFVIAHVSPDGTWRSPSALTPEAMAAAPALSFAQAVGALADLQIDAAVPQMFCQRGMTDLRALLELLAIPYLGNRPLQMAIGADKAKAKAIVAAAGVQVPAFAASALRSGSDDRGSGGGQAQHVGQLRRGGPGLIAVPLRRRAGGGVRPLRRRPCRGICRAGPRGPLWRGGARRRADLPALWKSISSTPRCGPIRRAADKLKRDDGGHMTLAAKTRSESWIVAADDPHRPRRSGRRRVCAMSRWGAASTACLTSASIPRADPGSSKLGSTARSPPVA